MHSGDTGFFPISSFLRHGDPIGGNWCIFSGSPFFVGFLGFFISFFVGFSAIFFFILLGLSFGSFIWFFRVNLIRVFDVGSFILLFLIWVSHVGSFMRVFLSGLFSILVRSFGLWSFIS